MNEQLMKVVERAVRPVRAGRTRKLQMRLELLAHLTGLYEEERTRLGDDAAAFAAARERFGDPAELSQELDRSVGVVGRLAWIDTSMEERLENLFGYREDRSLTWHLGRTFLTSVGTCAAIVGLIALGSFLLPEGRLAWVSATSVAPVLLFVVGTTFVVNSAALAIVTDFYDRDRPRWGSALLHATACVVAMTLIFCAVWWSILEDPSHILPQLPLIAFVNALVPAGLILVAWSSEGKARPHREWARLELDQ
ncbi:MAG TPA: hypothetical protein VGN57_18835 [Pirellulaceae bacterium]|jgi:hypothetical protein|nr:hypothetical protein [Pirellulaceae bacterium]